MTTALLNGPRIVPKTGSIDSLVMILHGYGADGDNLIELGRVWQNLLPQTEFIAPHAPTLCEQSSNGYQWFSLRDFSVQTMRDQARIAAPLLHDYSAQCLKERQLSWDRLIFVGFSQGAMMALYVGLDLPERCAGILSYAGISLHEAPLTPRSKPPVMLVHGDSDTVVPVHASQQAEQELKTAGIDVRMRIIAGLGHAIDQESVIAGNHFIRQCFNP